MIVSIVRFRSGRGRPPSVSPERARAQLGTAYQVEGEQRSELADVTLLVGRRVNMT
jgi:hypothetical protein